jgi:hypothetical protein
MVSVSVDEALTRVRDEKRRLRKEEKETMDFVEEEEMREEVRVWSESEESDERADAVAIEMEELFWMRKEVRMLQRSRSKQAYAKREYPLKPQAEHQVVRPNLE